MSKQNELLKEVLDHLTEEQNAAVNPHPDASNKRSQDWLAGFEYALYIVNGYISK